MYRWGIGHYSGQGMCQTCIGALLQPAECLGPEQQYADIHLGHVLVAPVESLSAFAPSGVNLEECQCCMQLAFQEFVHACKQRFGELRIGELRIGEMRFGELRIGELRFGELGGHQPTLNKPNIATFRALGL